MYVWVPQESSTNFAWFLGRDTWPMTIEPFT